MHFQVIANLQKTKLTILFENVVIIICKEK